ncbi:hypothetical protein EG68_04224 [Paragonimus skrjabini miyazakii]|uniref:Uncharacterized protein n=1 Tax=Paragonimus skrjabini miyazakii TaxID=59628 RepID=A0A8S9YYM1_9TREM|nr:hypothetical protein EG68_04224 [Paragonimus skrjabini miyazakii]
MHRKIRLPVDVIGPAPRLPSVRNRRMEQQFNRRHDATNRTFSLSQFVLAEDYRDGGEKWTAGRILRRTSRVTYDVEVQPSPVTVPSNRVIPLDVLLDTFDLSQEVSAAAPNPEALLPSTCTPTRWTDRPRRQVVHMQVNPRQRSYEQ